MSLRKFTAAVVLVLGCVPAVHAQDLLLAINEGVTYQDGGSTQDRYRALTDLLSRELKRPVKVVQVDKYAEFDRGLADERYDLVFIHPAHVGLKAVKSGKYSGVATAKGFTDYRARVMVPADSSIKSMQDLQGKKLGVPSLESITTVMFTAALRELNFKEPEKAYTATRYQDAVPFMVENKFVDAGVTGSAAVAKAWAGKGGRVVAETKPIPIKQFLVSRKLSEAERNRVQQTMLGLSGSDAGRAALSRINMTGFLPWDSAVMNDAMTRLAL
jgi:phosphonate transport system substrate-binding protein